MAVATIIVVDICVTLGLLLGVYYWSKNRKAKAKPVTRGAAAGGRPRGETVNRGWRRFPPREAGVQARHSLRGQGHDRAVHVAGHCPPSPPEKRRKVHCQDGLPLRF